MTTPHHAMNLFGKPHETRRVFWQWQDWPKGEEPAWTHWFGAIFWAAFAAYQVYGLIYGLFITEAATNWVLVAISPALAVVMFWASYHEARKALARS